MERTIRPVSAREFDELVDVLERGAGRHPSERARHDARSAIPRARALGVFEDERLVGGTASDALELTVPGGTTCPAARPTLTAIAPTSRGHGHATALLAHQLADFAERGEPLAIASTSTPGLVTGVGYAPADVAVEVQIQLADVRLRPDAGSVQRVRCPDPDEARRLLPALFERHRHLQVGQVLRTQEFWEMWWMDHELYRTGPGARFFVVAEDEDGRPSGYLTYRLAPGDLRDQPVSALVVEDLIAVTDSARRALWRFCLTFRQAQSARARNLPADDPLRWMLTDPRAVTTTRTRDFLWLRLVDVDRALSARTYGGDARLVLEVRDDVLPANTGLHCLDARRDGASCVRGPGPAHLSLDVADLAAVYLGGTTFDTLWRAGRVVERRRGAVAIADDLFVQQPAPWTVTDW